MNSVWAKFTLSDLPLQRWQTSSYLYKLVGLFGSWRDGSLILNWGELIGAILISLVLVISPFSTTTSIGILLLAITAYWLLLTLSENKTFGLNSAHFIVVLYWLIATIATAFSPLKSEAFSGWIKFTLYLLVFALSAKIFRSKTLLNWVITIFLHISLLVSVYGIRQQIFGVEQLATWNDPNSPLANDTRVYSYLGNPNLLAGYLLAGIALSLAAIFAWRGLFPKLLAILMFTLNSACLYFTDSRGGWIGMLALMAVFLLLLRYWWGEYLPPFWRIWLLPLVLGIFTSLIIIAIIVVEPLRLRIFSIFAGRGDSSNNFRLNVWLAVLDMIRDRPLIGIGLGNDVFNKIYPFYMKTGFTALSAYSIFLETAVESGLIGLTCFLWLIIVTINQGLVKLGVYLQQRKSQGFWIMAAIATMVGMLTHGLVDTVWYRPQINILWWLMLGIIASDVPTNSTSVKENYY